MNGYVTRRRVIAAVLIAGILAWLLWPDRQWVRVQELRAELANQSLTPEQRRATFEQLRTETAKLSAEQQARLAAERRQRFQADMARYAAMSPAEKKKYLDDQIDRQEQFRRQMQANGGPPGGPPADGQQRRPQTDEQRERRRQQRLDDSTPAFRAQMDQFRADMAARRQQRGLSPSPGFGRGR